MTSYLAFEQGIERRSFAGLPRLGQHFVARLRLGVVWHSSLSSEVRSEDKTSCFCFQFRVLRSAFRIQESRVRSRRLRLFRPFFGCFLRRLMIHRR